MLAVRTVANIGVVVGGVQPAETASQLVAATTYSSMDGTGTLVMSLQRRRVVKAHGAICFHSLETVASSCLTAGYPATVDMARQAWYYQKAPHRVICVSSGIQNPEQ